MHAGLRQCHPDTRLYMQIVQAVLLTAFNLQAWHVEASPWSTQLLLAQEPEWCLYTTMDLLQIHICMGDACTAYDAPTAQEGGGVWRGLAGGGGRVNGEWDGVYP